jgi:AraC family transcriptional regulator
MRDVLEHLHANLDEQLNLNALSEVASLSPFHFHRIFQAMLGESATDLVRRVRLERAAKRLGTTGDPITDIAFEAGYATHEAFIRAFRAAFGCNPTEYRKLPIGDGSLPCPNGIHYLRFPNPDVRFMDKGADMQVEIRNTPTRTVVCMPHKGEYWKIGMTFGRLGEWLKGRDIQTGPCLAIFHSDPNITPVEDLKSEACATVADDYKSDDPALFNQVLPGGEYAVALHVGPYDTLGASWNQFYGRWLPSSGREPGEAPSFEVYVDDCSIVPPAECRTELYIKLRE